MESKQLRITNRTDLYTLVDDDVFQWAIKRRWHCDRNNYVQTSIRINGISTKRFLHRLIMKEPQGLVIDHKNRNRLDNRKANLRAVTQAVNLQNVNPLSRNKKVEAA